MSSTQQDWTDLGFIARSIGVPYAEWAQQCHGISLALIQAGIVDGRVARGSCSGVGGQHSWIVVEQPYEGLPNCYDEHAEIVDPTLWSYRDDVEGIWLGAAADGLHTPHGAGNIWQAGCPTPGAEEPIALTPAGALSPDAALFVDMLGPLDLAGWGRLMRLPVGGWPAAEIVAAMDDTEALAALVPIDLLGMLTDRNPSGLYLRSAP